jgi:hypothetical protein
VLDSEHPGGVVHFAVAVVVVAYSAIQEVITQNAIERFGSRGMRPLCRGSHGHVHRNRDCAGSHELAVEFHQARVAGLDGTKLRVVADVGKLDSGAVDRVDEKLSFPCVMRRTVYQDRHLSEPSFPKDCTLRAIRKMPRFHVTNCTRRVND